MFRGICVGDGVKRFGLKGENKVPSTTEEWLQISAEFERKWQFPHTIGAIDGYADSLSASGTGLRHLDRLEDLKMRERMMHQQRELCLRSKTVSLEKAWDIQLKTINQSVLYFLAVQKKLSFSAEAIVMDVANEDLRSLNSHRSKKININNPPEPAVDLDACNKKQIIYCPIPVQRNKQKNPHVIASPSNKQPHCSNFKEC
ncbi:unnamed protein product [Acanthoscelides obtectus]|uniref:Uncharacterized protein n=1 Tax=Acanthoscelides obtectus TaxID=200917 RepID=A0A9P0LYN3_ACAOB|nr:unnamed protein product [Acanthoscelides obtectus]CAK1687975.1 hypothetical protein AOBTE_LOCUS36488 [Acanthoscelides obtectus]